MLGGGGSTPVWMESEPSGEEALTSEHEIGLTEDCEVVAK